MKHIVSFSHDQCFTLCVVCPVVILELELEHHCYLPFLSYLHTFQVTSCFYVNRLTVSCLQENFFHYATPSRSWSGFLCNSDRKVKVSLDQSISFVFLDLFVEPINCWLLMKSWRKVYLSSVSDFLGYFFRSELPELKIVSFTKKQSIKLKHVFISNSHFFRIQSFHDRFNFIVQLYSSTFVSWIYIIFSWKNNPVFF